MTIGGRFVYRHYLCTGRKDTLQGAVCDVCVDSGYLGRRGGRSHLYEHPKPYNKPYSVSLKPGYEVRPMTRSYYYDAVSAVRFTGEEEYHTNFVYQPERVEIKMRDTVAFFTESVYPAS